MKKSKNGQPPLSAFWFRQWGLRSDACTATLLSSHFLPPEIMMHWDIVKFDSLLFNRKFVCLCYGLSYWFPRVLTNQKTDQFMEESKHHWPPPAVSVLFINYMLLMKGVKKVLFPNLHKLNIIVDFFCFLLF